MLVFIFYKCLNFGVSRAPDILQNEIRQVINELNKTLNSCDDIAVHGQTHEEHDTATNLETLLATLKENNLTLNKLNVNL